jgi:DNA-directed RNA polymerase specialized sigma24 family protein
LSAFPFFTVAMPDRGCILATTVSDSQPDFQQELLAIREGPEVGSLALRRAMSLEVAEDALQSAYLAVSGVKNPGAIENLRAYFCRKLINEIYRELGQQHAAAVEDFTDLADTRQGRPGSSSPAPRPHPEEVSIRLLGRGWLRAFTARRGELAARVPRRSGDPVRYQRLIVRVAEHMLRTILGENADADINAVLSGGYAEWFAARDCSENTRHQRLLRARNDVCALLKTIVERGDLIS